MDLQTISVTVLTRNSQRYLKEVLTSLEPFGEVLLYDTGSEDDTFAIAKDFANVTIVEASFLGFGEAHNAATVSAKHHWILSIDSDEIVSKEMTQAISELKVDSQTVYAFPRNNYYNGKWIKWCGWYPDEQFRLYNRQKTSFSDAKVHEAIIIKHLSTSTLNAPIIHYSYASINDFLTKMQTYSTLFAEQNRGKKKSSLTKACLHGAFSFFKSYIIKKGFLGGYEGFVISSYNGHTTYYKYLKLYEANHAKTNDNGHR